MFQVCVCTCYFTCVFTCGCFRSWRCDDEHCAGEISAVNTAKERPHRHAISVCISQPVSHSFICRLYSVHGDVASVLLTGCGEGRVACKITDTTCLLGNALLEYIFHQLRKKIQISVEFCSGCWLVIKAKFQQVGVMAWWRCGNINRNKKNKKN